MLACSSRGQCEGTYSLVVVITLVVVLLVVVEVNEKVVDVIMAGCNTCNQ